jgi:hypothetical protein
MNRRRSRLQCCTAPAEKIRAYFVSNIERFAGFILQDSVTRRIKQTKVPELTHAQIDERAYKIYLANGCQTGRAQDDWLQAEYELLKQPVRELAKIAEGKSPRIPLGAKLLVGVVQAAILLAQTQS